MGAKFSAMLRKTFSRFYKKKCSICLVGLENSGKTTILSVLAHGAPASTVPTIGLNVRVVHKDRIEMKVWDIGGQKQYREGWARYAEGSDVCVFVVDTADLAKLPTVKEELHALLSNDSIATIPLLILANKIDLTPHVSERELVDSLGLEEIVRTPWIIMPVSALNVVGIDSVLEWLIGVAKD